MAPELGPVAQVEQWLAALPPEERLARLARAERLIAEGFPVDQPEATLRAIAQWRLKQQRLGPGQL